MTTSAKRLAHLHDIMARHVEHGRVPGLVSVVNRGGDSHVDVIGMTATDGERAMQRDSIFRISSMTKPVTAVATMILLEECVLRLDEPVDRLLPELADRRVVRRIDGPVDDTVPAERPITVRDLLTFRMGFGGYFGPCPVNDMAAPLQLSVGPPQPALPPEPDEWMRTVFDAAVDVPARRALAVPHRRGCAGRTDRQSSTCSCASASSSRSA